MKEVLSVFKMGKNPTIKSESLHTDFDYRVNGVCLITKGEVTLEIEYFSSVTKMRYPKCIEMQEIDTNYENMCIGGVPIDDQFVFMNMLKNNGLTTAASQLEIKWEDKCRAIASSLKGNEMLTKLFGEDFIMFTALSKEEQWAIRLKYVIDDFENCTNWDKENVYKYYQEQFKLINEEGFVPSLEIFKRIRDRINVV